MKKNRTGLLLVFMLFACAVMAQRESDKLKKKEKKLLREIANTKSLISKTRNSEKITIAELAILNQQIQHREELIDNYSAQVRNLNRLMEENQSVVHALQTDVLRLKKNYIKMARYAYRHRNTYHNLLFVFASSSYHQAYLRVKYLRQLSDYRKKQVAMIKFTRTAIQKKIEKLALHKQQKESLVVQQETERQSYVGDKEKQQQMLAELKGQEGKLRQELDEKERDREKLAQKIRQAIEEEMRKEQERLAAEAAKKKKNANTQSTAKKENKKTNTTTASKKEVNPLTITPEVQLESDQFEANKGKLPWPVTNGEITSHFGRNQHPTLAGVVTNNNGIDIGTRSGAIVRSVFKGTVSSIFVIPNAGKCVIISHGIYRTVYANLADVFVTKGQTIDTKQTLGTLLEKEGTRMSESHFEIWKIDGTQMNKQNPGLWLTQ